MVRMKVKHFGAIESGFTENEDGFFDINRFTLFIGDQGTGKSTVAKLFSIFSWLEKSFARELFQYDDFSVEDFFSLCETQRIPTEYVTEETEIVYKGDFCSFSVKNKFFKAEELPTKDNYKCPKIQYFPSERNLLSVMEQTDKIDKLPPMVKELSSELKKANKFYGNDFRKLGFLGYKVTYNEYEDMLYVQAPDSDLKIPITKASSGLQSMLPLVILVDYLQIENNKSVLEKIKQAGSHLQQLVVKLITETSIKNKIELIIKSGIIKNVTENELQQISSSVKSIINTCNLNIVEEPEQNLFPSSQVKILEGLIKHYNAKECNQLFITTHSPYILSSLNNYIYANDVYKRSGKQAKNMSSELYVDINDISAYKVENGVIKNIKDNEYKLIDASEIDACSSRINAIYQEIMDLDGTL